jgi:hypothetical protein
MNIGGDYEEDDIQNDEYPKDMDSEFLEMVSKIKWKLYEMIILSPELGTELAQNTNLIDIYKNEINNLHILTINAQKGLIIEKQIKNLPNKVQDDVKNLLFWILNFYKKNRHYETIPYSDYLRRSLHVYVFNHRKMLGGEYFIDSD